MIDEDCLFFFPSNFAGEEKKSIHIIKKEATLLQQEFTSLICGIKH